MHWNGTAGYLRVSVLLFLPLIPMNIYGQTTHDAPASAAGETGSNWTIGFRRKRRFSGRGGVNDRLASQSLKRQQRPTLIRASCVLPSTLPTFTTLFEKRLSQHGCKLLILRGRICRSGSPEYIR